ncbi:MAG: protein-glutamate O-methyltransferase CheR [Lautropia sp.]
MQIATPSRSMELDQATFDALVRLFRDESGIVLGPAKRQLVTGRIQRLAQARGYDDLNRYAREIVLQGTDRAEVVRVIDRLTTNETYFFRESAHFDHLASLVGSLEPRSEFRVWSAASSSGEEAYSIAMLLADKVGMRQWRIVGTDLSTAMVAAARKALYPMERARDTPASYLRRFCLKGHGEYDGYLLIRRELRERVHFETANLMRPLPDIGPFDVIFLRNVLIYFQPAEKREIVSRVAQLLKPGGQLFVGHAESLGVLPEGLRPVRTAVYARS